MRVSASALTNTYARRFIGSIEPLFERRKENFAESLFLYFDSAARALLNHLVVELRGDVLALDFTDGEI